MGHTDSIGKLVWRCGAAIAASAVMFLAGMMTGSSLVDKESHGQHQFDTSMLADMHVIRAAPYYLVGDTPVVTLIPRPEWSVHRSARAEIWIPGGTNPEGVFKLLPWGTLVTRAPGAPPVPSRSCELRLPTDVPGQYDVEVRVFDEGDRHIRTELFPQCVKVLLSHP